MGHKPASLPRKPFNRLQGGIKDPFQAEAAGAGRTGTEQSADPSPAPNSRGPGRPAAPRPPAPPRAASYLVAPPVHRVLRDPLPELGEGLNHHRLVRGHGRRGAGGEGGAAGRGEGRSGASSGSGGRRRVALPPAGAGRRVALREEPGEGRTDPRRLKGRGPRRRHRRYGEPHACPERPPGPDVIRGRLSLANRHRGGAVGRHFRFSRQRPKRRRPGEAGLRERGCGPVRLEGFPGGGCSAVSVECGGSSPSGPARWEGSGSAQGCQAAPPARRCRRARPDVRLPAALSKSPGYSGMVSLSSV